MWANAQRDGRPVEYRWAPSVQCHKVWLAPTTRVPCSNGAKTRNPLKSAGVPKTHQQISAASGQSSPYCETMWGRYCCLTIFFRLLIRALVAKTEPDKVGNGAEIAIFLRPVFSASRVQHVSDLHSNFTLRPHHVVYGHP